MKEEEEGEEEEVEESRVYVIVAMYYEFYCE